jgi:hypothetical protein
MPRIAVCLNYADRDKPRFSGENDYLDYCAKCYKKMTEAAVAKAYELPVDAVDKIDDEHPSYTEDDRYECTLCYKKLGMEDN